MEEKVAIENQSWEQYYEVMEEDLKNGDSNYFRLPIQCKTER